MKNAFYLFLGIIFTILISATTVSVMTVKPQTPKQTIVKDFWTKFSIQEDMAKYMIYQAKKGFIVKTITLDSEENGYQRGIVVMEKY